MTMAELIYFIGMGVAFLMSCVGFSNMSQSKSNKEDIDIGGVLTVSVLASTLSWAIPIWWLGYHFIYEKDKKRK